MKKGIFIIVAIICCATYLFITQTSAPNEQSSNDDSANLKSEVLPQINESQSDNASPIEKVLKLENAVQQCQKRPNNFDAQVNEIHQILIKALKTELANGTSIQTLLSYSDLYQTFYSSYDDLLRKAIISERRTNYDFAQSAAILAKWQGLEVLEGFNKEKIAMIVEQINTLKNAPGLSINISLADNIKKESLYALLDNTDNFTTYFESPLHVQGSPAISPSILFTLNAEKLSLTEFEQAISTNNFTVNEVALAIEQEIENDYILALLNQVSSVNDMPIYSHLTNTVFFNLADLAVSKFNLPILKALSNLAVTPTNQQGLLTPLDIAIASLPKSGNLTLGELNKNHTDMLEHLIANGYKVHGGFENHDNMGKGLFLHSSFNTTQGIYIQQNTNFDGYQYFSQFPVVKQNMLAKLSETDNSAIANALMEVKQAKAALNKHSEQCQQLTNELLAAKELKTTRQGYKKVQLIEEQYGSDFEHVLQNIDPVLVNYWWNSLRFSLETGPANENDSQFIAALANQEFQKAYEYSLANPLSQGETDYLFKQLTRAPNDLIAIWNNRVLAKQPTTLIVLQRIPLKQWQQLANAGFDFSLTDIYGNDAYLTAASISSDAVKFLIDKNIPTDPKKLGVDTLDLALEQSYKNASVSTLLPLALKLIKNFEQNHFARMARLRTFYPDIYNQIITENPALKPAKDTELNHYLFKYH